MDPLGFAAGNKEKNDRENLENKVKDALRNEFAPEFLNRIDEQIIFNHLSKEDIHEIVSLELSKVKDRLQRTKAIEIKFSEGIKNKLVEEGFDKDLGARPLKRKVQKLILDPLSLKIITGEVVEGAIIKVKMSGKEINFDVQGVKKKLFSKTH